MISDEAEPPIPSYEHEYDEEEMPQNLPQVAFYDWMKTERNGPTKR